MMKGMLRFLPILPAVLLSALTCAAQTQDDFLRDMEAGQAARWEITDNASEEELADMSFRYVYLDAELEYIGKYAEAEFDNGKFDELAHLYVSGVNLQREAVGFYEDFPYVFESEWTSGYMMRSYAMADLHDYYGLAVPEDKMAECRNYLAGIGAEQTAAITEYGRTLESEHLLDPESISITPFNDEYDMLSVKVRNVSESDMRDMSLTVNLLDAGGDILRNIPLYNTGILSPGQGVTVSGTYPKENADALEFMTVSYTKEDGTYVDNTLDGFGKMSIADLVSGQIGGTAAQTEAGSGNQGSEPVSSEEPAESAAQVQETQPAAQETPDTPQASSGQDASGTADSERKAIEKALRSRIASEYSGTSVDRITVNEDYGTEDNPDDLIVLVYLTWNVNNSPETSEKVLKMYSDDIAVLLGEQFGNVQELAVFWQVPHLTENTSKWSYERKSDGMHQTDNMIGW